MTQFPSTSDGARGERAPWPTADSAVRLYVDHEEDESHYIDADAGYGRADMRKVLAKARTLGLEPLEPIIRYEDETERTQPGGFIRIWLEGPD